MLFVDRHIRAKGLQLSDLKNTQNDPEFYHHKKVRQHLVLCYGFKCCYCESIIASEAYCHVDHFYPKKPSSGLPAQFLGNYQLYANYVINDIRNYHIACERCNLLKSDFIGEALSPNFYHDGSQWKESFYNYIIGNIWYKGSYVKCTQKYQDFCDKLKFNGKTDGEKVGLHSSLLVERTRYFEETRRLLQDILNLCIKKQFEGAKTMLNQIRDRFKSKSRYSIMIVTNLGMSFDRLETYLRNH